VSQFTSAVDVIGVVGSGAMGAGITQVALMAGLRVLLHDSNPVALSRAREQIEARLVRLEEKRQLDGRVQEFLAQLSLAPDLAALAQAQLVIASCWPPTPLRCRSQQSRPPANIVTGFAECISSIRCL